MPADNTPALSRLLRPGALDRRYDVYDELRSAGTIHWDSTYRKWLVTGYFPAVEALSSKDLSSRHMGARATDWLAREARQTARFVYDIFDRQLLFTDAPDHTNLRGLASWLFAPREMNELSGEIEATVDRLLHSLERQPVIDIVGEFASPLAARTIGRVLDFPAAECERFAGWMSAIGKTLAWDKRNPVGTASALQDAQECLVAIAAHIECGVGGATTGARDAFAMVDREDLVANLAFLLYSGYETTVNLIGNGVLTLLNHPRQAERLLEEPGLLEPGIDEILRFESPIQIVGRVARTATYIADQRVQAGEDVFVIIGSANRDPARFDDPEQFRVGRGDSQHLALSHGAHYCLGARLARIEAAAAIGGLIDRFPRCRLASESVAWKDSLELRGLRELLVARL